MAKTKESRWKSIAARLGNKLAETATERDQAGNRPLEEIAAIKQAGLVNLLIPARLGGEGGTLSDAIDVVTEVSRGDGSIGTLLAFHYYTSSVPRFWDYDGEGGAILARSARENWFWGNITQPLEQAFSVEALADGRFTLNGKKRWSTGAAVGDVTTVVGRRTDIRELFYAVIPVNRAGLEFDFDWNFIGLNLAETVQSRFDNVIVESEEVIRSTIGAQTGFAPFYVPAANLLYAAVIMGSTWAALKRARQYTQERSRPLRSEPATRDPYVLLGYGEAVISAQAVRANLESAARRFDEAWENRQTIDENELSDLFGIASAARYFAAEVGLAITSKIHDLTGASSASKSVGLDRHWRDIRALTLHDPLVYSASDIGNQFLNGVKLGLPAFV